MRSTRKLYYTIIMAALVGEKPKINVHTLYVQVCVGSGSSHTLKVFEDKRMRENCTSRLRVESS